MNPRFGGGYPFSHEAGANAPAAIIAWLNGDEVEKEWLVSQEDVVSAKCDRIVLRKHVVL
jgi:carbamoyl-phosphate synthase large subunit